MDNKLQELTDKLYQEGVSKGNQEAEQIIAKAKSEAQQLINEAEKKALAIVEEAEKKSRDLAQNTKTELQIASRQTISSLSQEIVSLINGTITTQAIQQATSDKEFIQNLILVAVQNWATKQDLQVAVSEKDKEAITSYFAGKAKEMLDKGLSVESANGIRAGFQIGPSDGSYKVSFTEADFINFFKEFLRPKLVELLFEQK